MRITTGNGDQGLTFAGGTYVEKSSGVVHALGWLDEALARLYHARLVAPEEENHFQVIESVVKAVMQHIGIAATVAESAAGFWLDEMQATIAKADAIPGDWLRPVTEYGARLDLLRCAIRHAERYSQPAVTQSDIRVLLNRLSDYVFALTVLHEVGDGEET